MKIETKFDFGQRVQAIIYSEEEYVEKCPMCEGNGYFVFKEKRKSAKDYIWKYKEN